MSTELEFSDINAETKGAMCPGRLKFTEQNIIFKNSRTGKVEQVQINDIDLANWQKFIDNWGIRLFLKNGSLHRFIGFKESEKERISKYFKLHYSQEMAEKELSLRGWNWGTAKFNGSVLSFEVGSHPAFEIPLNNVSQCPTGKNEVTIEFHQNDDAPVGLLEMRFHIPSAELAGDLDPVEAFHKQVMKNASVISVSGDAIAIFREIQCLTPRGRYDIKLYQSFFQLHGKTFDYKIPILTVLRLFMLPHKDGRQHFFVVSLDPPIKQGQTRYHFLVFLFGQDDETSIELPFTEQELKEKYEGKLEKELQGPTYEVLGKVMKSIVNRKITVPGGFIGHSGFPAVGCSYKAAAGLLYPLERGFIYIHKPPLHIRFEEIASVNFARSGGSTRSFDFEVELKNSVVHTFSSIEKEEYGKLYDFITAKKLRVKNRGKMDKPKSSYDDFGDSDQEGEPDAYLARVKREAEERDDEDEGEDSDESTDEDFNPNQVESDVAEEYDSNPTPTDSDADSDEGGGGGGGDDEEKEKKKKKKKERKPKAISEKPRKRRQKKEKDENRPKRAASAYMLWFNDNREKIKTDNPGIAFIDIAKKGGELWKKLEDKSEWEAKAAKLKAEYDIAMKEYKASGGGADKAKSKPEKTKSEKSGGGSAKKPTPKEKSTPQKEGKTTFISKEYISEDDSSSDDSDSAKNKKPPPPKKLKLEAEPPKKSKKSEDENDDDDDDDDDTKDSDSGSEDDKKAKSKKDDKNKPIKKESKSDDETKPVKIESKSDDETKPTKKESKSDDEEEEEEETAESTPATSDESGNDSD